MGRPRVKFLDDANATHPVHSNTRPHQSCVDRMHHRPSQSFERSNISCQQTYSSSAFVSLQILIALHRIQPTRFLQQALHGECVDFYRNKREEQDSNSFSTSGTSQQRLHVTCPHLSCLYEGRAMYTSIYIYIYIYIGQTDTTFVL